MMESRNITMVIKSCPRTFDFLHQNRFPLNTTPIVIMDDKQILWEKWHVLRMDKLSWTSTWYFLFKNTKMHMMFLRLSPFITIYQTFCKSTRSYLLILTPSSNKNRHSKKVYIQLSWIQCTSRGIRSICYRRIQHNLSQLIIERTTICFTSFYYIAFSPLTFNANVSSSVNSR